MHQFCSDLGMAIFLGLEFLIAPDIVGTVAVSLSFQDLGLSGSYILVTILIDERADGVHISYDKMASLLAPYGSPEALNVARSGLQNRGLTNGSSYLTCCPRVRQELTSFCLSLTLST